jgi:hypothetical protein
MNIKKSLFTTLIVLVLSFSLQAKCETKDSLYEKAYQEIYDMLDGKTKISLKRAVFVSENAFLNGSLNYESDFCRPISQAVSFLYKFISANKLGKYKTAKQIALCDFMFRPWSGNGYKPFIYDMTEEYPKDDWHYQLISRTLKTHNGQCYSLPWTMKLFAEELGADIHIALAPRHCFIMYKDIDNLFPENWVNVEVTSHQYQPTWWIKKDFQILDSAIIIGTYLTPLSDKQALACQMAHLALSYQNKYKVYDEFTLKCVNVALKYFPNNPNAILTKGKSLDAILITHLKTNGWIHDALTDDIDRQSKECVFALKHTYWTQETEEMRKHFEHYAKILKTNNNKNNKIK